MLFQEDSHDKCPSLPSPAPSPAPALPAASASQTRHLSPPLLPVLPSSAHGSVHDAFPSSPLLQLPVASRLPICQPPALCQGDHRSHSTPESSRLRGRGAGTSLGGRTLRERKKRAQPSTPQADSAGHTDHPSPQWLSQKPSMTGLVLSPAALCTVREAHRGSSGNVLTLGLCQSQALPRSSPSALGRYAPSTPWLWTEAPAAARSYSAACRQKAH